MKSIAEYINEANKSKKYGTLVTHIEIDMNNDSQKLAKTINDGIFDAISKYKVIRVSAVEKANEKAIDDVKARKASALERAEKQIIKLMQTKPGILKRSPEKRQEWVDNKLKKEAEAFDKSWAGKPWLSHPEVNDDKIYFGWYKDIHSGSSHNVYTGISRVNALVKDIVDILERSKDNPKDAWSHIKTIEIATNSFIEKDPSFNLVPTFDEETEKQLSDDVARFGEFMINMYNSGRYMGD